tara:strand:+ start:1859 stop:2833 length:975 start_codon:yes stop_codon:yes gene_type:complete
MSNPWAKSFEELRSPYLQEKMAKKDYDGDGKVESGKDEYFGSRDKAIKKAMGKKVEDKKKVAEHHQKDADGNTIPHGDGTPSSVEEMVDKKFGSNNKMNLNKAIKNIQVGNVKKIEKKIKNINKEEVVLESDKKGSGSGTKDACYHKVKSRYSVWPSAYASGALVKCRKAGAKNWGNSSKKEEFDYYQMPMKSFGDIVGECWKTHKQQGTKMKGGKVVPNCVPKNEEAQVDEGAPYTVNVADKTGNTPAYQNFKKGMKNKLTGDPLYKAGVGLDKAHYDWKTDFGNVEEALKGKKLEVQETGVKNKIEINPELKTEAAKAPVKK